MVVDAVVIVERAKDDAASLRGEGGVEVGDSYSQQVLGGIS